MERSFARVEAQKYALMLAYDEQRREESKQAPSPTAALVERSMIALEIGQAMGLSEGQVLHRLSFIRTVRSRTPHVWTAFLAGHIDSARGREIADAINKLTDPVSVDRLDETVVAYASTHTLAELRRWLRRFVERVEHDQATARAEAARKNRYIQIEHGDDGMSYLNAYIPSIQAAAIERRLHAEARRQPSDGRTLQQKEADLLISWATSTEGGDTSVHATIAVSVDADVLAGAREGFAESPDNAWSTPAAWIADLARTANPFWYRILRDPVTRDVLSVEYLGRFAPKILRQALELRDGTCATPGCLTPAWKCEIDHIIPWPRGQTTGSNLQPKSKKHHSQKGHGLTPALVGSER